VTYQISYPQGTIAISFPVDKNLDLDE